MPTLLEKIAEQTAQSKADALASYRAILHREEGGQARPADSKLLVDVLDTLGLTVQDAESDLQALRAAAAAESAIPPQPEIDAAATDSGKANENFLVMEKRHAEERFAADAAVTAAMVKSERVSHRLAINRQTLAELRQNHPRVFAE